MDKFKELLTKSNYLTSFFTCSILFLIFLILIQTLISRFSRNGKLLRKIPTPPTFPLLGNGPIFLAPLKYWPRIISWMCTWCGPTFCVDAVFKSFIFTKEPEVIKKILPFTRHSDKAFVYKMGHFYLGENAIVTAPVSIWKADRKVVNPGLNTISNFPKFLESFNENGKRLADRLFSNNDTRKGRDIYVDLFQTTTEIVFETMFDYPIHDKPDIAHDIAKAAINCSDVAKSKLIRPWINIPPTAYLLGYTKVIKENVAMFRKHFNQIHCKMLADDKRSVKFTSYLHLLYEQRLATCDKLDVDELFYQFNTIIMGGTEVPSTVLRIVLYLIALYPEVQLKLREEIEAIFGIGADFDVKLEDVGRLKYMDLVLKESMRLLPATPLHGRCVGEDVDIGQGRIIPKGTSVHFLAWDIHNDPEIWENPKIFNPDRFLPENLIGRDPYAYLPFSHGPRSCPAQKFGNMELKVLLCQILAKLEVSTDLKLEDVRYTYGIVLHFDGVGLPVRFRK
ncbi:cytochrome P450 4C1 isoform X2 [Folsomia candida]|nr:cytochrome P450 4C1 isoform X2 [Folsomia candida]